MRVITSEAIPDEQVVTKETSPDPSDELINKINCLQLNELNDKATLCKEIGLEAQVNERGPDRNQTWQRLSPYTRNPSVRSSNFEISSPPITNEPKSRERLFLSGGGTIELHPPSFPPSKIIDDSYTYVPPNLNVPSPENVKARDEEYLYTKLEEIICENEVINPIPFDELSNPGLPEEVSDLILESENKVENVAAISPNYCVPETCDKTQLQNTQFGTSIVYVQMCNPPVMIQNKKLPLIFPKANPESHVQKLISFTCKKESQEDKDHKRFCKLNRDVGVGKRDEFNRTVLHILIMKKDKFAVYVVKKINNCFQRKHTDKLIGITSLTSFINSCDNSGETPLYYAALYNQPLVMECLLNFGADPNVAETQDGKSPLHAASERGKRYLDVVTCLCQSDIVDMNICTKKGKSALHVAVESHGVPHEDESENICEEIDSRPIIEHLLRKNAKLTMQDRDGKTALHLAVERCKPDLIIILEAYAHDWKEAVNMMDKKGSTALHIAAVLETEEQMQCSIIMDLLSRNAKPTIKDSLGRLPAELVELVSPERKDISDLLKREWSQECMQYVHI